MPGSQRSATHCSRCSRPEVDDTAPAACVRGSALVGRRTIRVASPVEVVEVADLESEPVELDEDIPMRRAAVFAGVCDGRHDAPLSDAPIEHALTSRGDWRHRRGAPGRKLSNMASVVSADLFGAATRLAATLHRPELDAAVEGGMAAE